MQHQEAIDYVVHHLRNHLPKNLVYHAVEHTLDVIEKVEKIGKAENANDEEMQILLTAAAYHDSGFLNVYQNHEEEGCDIVSRHLPKFDFSSEQIKMIHGLIMATKIPQTPKNHLEKILCDADLDYLGGDNYYPIANGLYKELNLNGKNLSQEDWLNMQIGFLEMHSYWTNYAKNNLEAQKQTVLAELKKKKV